MQYTGSNLNGKQFSSTVIHLAQQKTSRFRPNVRIESVNNAEEAYFNLFSPEDDPTQDTDRHGDTPVDEYEANRRKVVPVPFEKGTLIAQKDAARMTVDPQNPVVMSHAMAFGRKTDKICYAAMIGAAYKGKNGTTEVTFAADSASINSDGTVSTLGTAASNSGLTETPMNYSKMLTMLTLFNEEDVDPTIKKCWAISPNDVKHLLNLEEVINSDYNRNSAAGVAEGRIEYLLGFNFFWWNFLDTDSDDGTCRRTVAWAEDGVVLAYINEMNTDVSIRNDKKNNVQIYTTMDLGSVRLEGEKVHECLNEVTQTLTPSNRES